MRLQDIEEVEATGGHELEGAEVTAGLEKVFCSVHGEKQRGFGRVSAPSLHGRDEDLGFRFDGILKIFNDNEAADRPLEGRADGQALLLTVDLDGPVLGLGTKDYPPSNTERRPLRSPPSPPGLLLLVGFPSSSPHLPPC